MRNNARFFCDEDNFIRLTIGTVNNIIEVGYLEFGITADAVDITNNMVYCSFKGQELPQIDDTDLDTADKEDCFAYLSKTGTSKNIIKIAVDKMLVDSPEKAKKYITGMRVDYLLEDLVYTNSAQTPLYQFKAYLSDGTLIQEADAIAMDAIKKKMDALDRDASINAIGYNEYYIRRAIAKKS